MAIGAKRSILRRARARRYRTLPYACIPTHMEVHRAVHSDLGRQNWFATAINTPDGPKADNCLVLRSNYILCARSKTASLGTCQRAPDSMEERGGNVDGGIRFHLRTRVPAKSRQVSMNGRWVNN